MYAAHYINPLIQFGRIELDLILTDDSGILPEVRIQKSFPDSATASDFEAAAVAVIESILNEPVAPIIPVVDMPEGMGV